MQKTNLYYVFKIIKNKLYIFVYNLGKLLILVIIFIAAIFTTANNVEAFYLHPISIVTEARTQEYSKPKTQFADCIQELQVFKPVFSLQNKLNPQIPFLSKKPLFPKIGSSISQKGELKNKIYNFHFSELQKIISFNNLFIYYLKLNATNSSNSINLHKKELKDFQKKKKKSN